MVPCRTQINKLETQIEKLIQENNELKRRLLAYENAHTPPSLQRKKKKPPINNSNKKPGAPKGHKKYTRPEVKPTSSIEHTESLCPHCSNPLGNPIKIERVIEEEIPDPQPLEVKEHLIHHYKCSKCNKTIIAENDAPQGSFGKNAETHITLLKYEDRLPLRKVAQSVKRHYGLTLSHAAVYKIHKRVTAKLKEPYYEVIKRIRRSNVIYVDETKYKLNGETWWLWVFESNHDTLFVIRKSRSKKVIEEVLGKKFKGIISADGWVVYQKFTDLLQRCWAHLLRETDNIAKDNEEFIPFHQSISALFNKILAIRNNPPPELERRILAENMKKELIQIVQQMNPYTKFKRIAKKIMNGINHWFTTVVHLEVEPTNNLAEQALRELIVQRKIMGGLKAEKGAEILETIATMITSWKKQGLSVFSTLRAHL